MMAFDTHAAYKVLREGERFTHEQAEVIIGLLDRHDADTTTKADLRTLTADLKIALAEHKAELQKFVFGNTLALAGLILALRFLLH